MKKPNEIFIPVHDKEWRYLNAIILFSGLPDVYATSLIIKNENDSTEPPDTKKIAQKICRGLKEIAPKDSIALGVGAITLLPWSEKSGTSWNASVELITSGLDKAALQNFSDSINIASGGVPEPVRRLTNLISEIPQIFDLPQVIWGGYELNEKEKDKIRQSIIKPISDKLTYDDTTILFNIKDQDRQYVICPNS